MTELTGQVLGDRYRVEAFLGRGGMADVYKVRDLQRAVFLAMKVLHADLAKNLAFLQHFEQEAQTLERLQHPNIVRFYGLEKADNIAYILMDFIDGLTLRREIFLFKNGLRPMRALEIMQPVCAALYYAHQMGMIHCDIKPANIITHRNSTVFLTDFGIARATEPGSISLAGIGTPGYMAPEQFEGIKPDPATDIYSLGVVLYEMLTGGLRPHSGDSAQTGGTTAQRIIWEKQHLPAPSPRLYNPEITPEVEAVVMCCLQKDPQRRFRSTLELLHALEVAVCGTQPPEDEVQTRVDLVKKAGRSHQGRRGERTKEQQIRRSAQEAGQTPAVISSARHEETKEQVRVDPPAAISAEPTPRNEQAPGSPEAEKAKPGGQASIRLEALPAGNQPPLLRGLNKLNPWLIAGAGILALALIGNAIFSGHAYAPTPTETPALAATPSIAPVSTASAPLLPSATAAVAVTATAEATATFIQPTKTFIPEPTPLGGSQQVAFASDRSGSVQVWIMDTSNPENRQQVTEAQGGACQPAWSPDGKQIAFTTPCIGPSVYYPGSTIKIVRLADKRVSDLPVKVPGIAGAFDPAWSPDGGTLAFTAIVGQQTEIRAIGLKDLETSVLANRGTKSAQPSWSRDGKYIAFITSDARDWDALWYMQSTGESQEPLARSAQFSAPIWAPDGVHIFASMNRKDSTPILAQFDRRDPTRDAVLLLDDGYQKSRASISPDGSWIIFWTDISYNNPEIIMTSLDGKQTHQLTNNRLRDFHPAWSPK